MRVAIVGAGFAGAIHAQAWRAVGAALIVIDTDPIRARGLAARWGGEAATDPARALSTDVDVVSICTPTSLHAELAIAASRAGKHVLCEKPMALTVADCEAMAAEATTAGTVLMVGHVLRFWPEYDRLRELAASGELGELRALHCYRYVTRPGEYGGWMLDPTQGLGLGEVLIHDLDIATTLSGDPAALAATGVVEGAGWRQLSVLVRNDAGVAVTVCAGWGTPAGDPFAAGFRAMFDGGTVEYDSRRRPTWQVVRGDSVEAGESPRAATEGGPWQFDAAGYLAEVDYFAGCVRDARPPARCTPQQATRAVELVLAAQRGASSGAEVPVRPIAG